MAAERGFELLLTRRNVARLRRRGAREAGRGVTRAMALFHAGVLLACLLEGEHARVRTPRWLRSGALVALLAAQALRYWAVLTLGERWSIRVLTVPGAPPVTSGPYRFLRHPNYLAVIVEMAALPVGCGAFRTAALASLGNAVLLTSRIRVEERALGGAYRAALADRPRLSPVALFARAGESPRRRHVGRRD